MLNRVQFLEPLIQKERIPKERYNNVPAHVQFLTEKQDHVWKLTITPRKTATSGHCRTFIVVPANYRSGPLILENAGRQPRTAPPLDQDDLRPIVFYAFGTGTQKIRVFLDANHNNWVETTIDFTK